MQRAIFATFFVAVLLQSFAYVVCDPVFLKSPMDQAQLGNETNSFMLYWTYNTTYIQFEVQFNGALWGLFGIQVLRPSSTKTDGVLFWLNNDGTGHFSNVFVICDDDQSEYCSLDRYNEFEWLPINAIKINGTFVFHFGRNIKRVCEDSSYSYFSDIMDGKVPVGYSVGNVNTTYMSQNSISIKKLDQRNITILNPSNGPFTCPPNISVPSFDSKPSTSYNNYIDLMDAGMARLYWNYTDTTFIGELQIRTSGWVSFGFSPDGNMPGSNVMVFYMDQNNMPNFSERYLYGDRASPYSVPRGANRTANQSWKLIYQRYYNGYTIVGFQRPIVLCGANQLTIPTGTPYGIFAFGSTPAPGADIGYHGSINRGSKRGPFVSVGNTEYNDSYFSLPEVFTISNVILPYSKTSYYCQLFEVPQYIDYNHVYYYTISLPTVNANNIKRIILYECPGYNGSPELQSDSCNQTAPYCSVVAFGWSAGGKTYQVFPDDTGYPMGNGNRYFRIEVFYNNPEEKLGYISQINFIFYLTSKLRPNELGVLTLGTTSDVYGIAIPPGISSFKLNTYCSNDCLRGKLNQLGQNITAISVLPYTHLTGTSVSSKILRNGQMVGYLANNPFHDFNIQYNLALSPRINITRNDALITTCTYNTQSRSEFTFGGEGITDEMCLVFVTYYPRNNLLRSCMSAPDFGSYVKLFTNLTASYNMIIDDSSLNDSSKVFTEAYESVSVNDKVRNLYQIFFQTTPVFEMCDKSYNPGPLSPLTYSNNYTEPNPCNGTNSNDKSFIQKVTEFFNKLWDKFKNLFKN